MPEPDGPGQPPTRASGQAEPDEPLVAALRGLFARADPVPAVVLEAARAALGWRRLDADLAELLADSALESDAFAGTRGAGGPVRSVSFSAGELTIDLEVHSDGAGRTLLGQLSPGRAATIEIQAVGDESAVSVPSDGLGRFRARLPRGGSIRLRLAGGAGPGAWPAVETSWIAI
jgi:hypothetical protein